jgi:thiol:disulfide interchange protein
MKINSLHRGLIVILIIIAAVSFAASRLSTHAKDTTLRGWYQGADGYAKAKEEQQKTNKPIAVYFYTDRCASCKQLRENVLSAPEVKEYIRDLIPVKINMEAGVNEKKLGEQFGVRGFPAFYLIAAGNNKPVNILRSVNIEPLQFIDACEKAV